ncbi:hypothetical protein ADIWIN_1458 [Winogradskyella psychrotolerans RS-3]|uniref:Uncharacterized protein n=2 Tax=Winogradskyella TaxID=286104 RepID=S7XBP3_9FLAO|nr:hypothetical protein ADIWIN_1458 [Winogradskyella psychrotolerans RS-3]
MVLSEEEQYSLYKMLQEHIRKAKRKSKSKTPLMTNDEVDRCLLKTVFNVSFDE